MNYRTEHDIIAAVDAVIKSTGLLWAEEVLASLGIERKERVFQVTLTYTRRAGVKTPNPDRFLPKLAEKLNKLADYGEWSVDDTSLIREVSV